MAMPGLRKHPKFRRLRHLLQMPPVYVQAHLEAMWQFGYETANAYLGSSDDVELAAEWDDSGRPPGQWFQAALEARWIDDLGKGCYQIHDLLEHAPDYVKKRAKRRAEKVGLVEIKDLRPVSADNGGQRSPMSAHPTQPNPTQPKKIHPAAPGDAKKKPRKEPAGVHANFIRAFEGQWQALYCQPYPFNGGKDGDAVKWIRGQLKDDESQWRAVLVRFFADRSEWICNQRHALSVLRSQFVRYAAPELPHKGQGTPVDQSGLLEFVQRGKNRPA